MKNKHLPIASHTEPEVARPGSTPGSKFTAEFKRMAVARLRESDNATLLALELGNRRNQLYKWAKALDELKPDDDLKVPGRPPASEESEVVRLRCELAKTQQELAVL